MKVLYFAWLRERLNKGEETVSPPKGVTTVAGLMDWMADEDEGFALAFEKRDLIKVALDSEIVDHDASLDGVETVAFFPPMTGG